MFGSCSKWKAETPQRVEMRKIAENSVFNRLSELAIIATKIRAIAQTLGILKLALGVHNEETIFTGNRDRVPDSNTERDRGNRTMHNLLPEENDNPTADPNATQTGIPLLFAA